MNDNPETRRGPSFSLLLAGVLAVLVSVWAFIGPDSWPKHSIVPVGWIVVLAAIVVGVALVVSPRRRKNKN
ncbi:hypothetical protein [Nocardia terpenica]|uniref:Uncharacterized protein n=1 Tax=Nocardia terpenica TaxID=455432 RepID=A0A291REU8_9NOCA|nr:hypothetical protein [Nocardia terpenica]ATL65838.1 hypothetical protein CRH09_06000 [Nocardia terpenica]